MWREGADAGVMAYSVSVDRAPKMSCAVLECDVAMLQNDMP